MFACRPIPSIVTPRKNPINLSIKSLSTFCSSLNYLLTEYIYRERLDPVRILITIQSGCPLVDTRTNQIRALLSPVRFSISPDPILSKMHLKNRPKKVISERQMRGPFHSSSQSHISFLSVKRIDSVNVVKLTKAYFFSQFHLFRF